MKLSMPRLTLAEHWSVRYKRFYAASSTVEVEQATCLWVVSVVAINGRDNIWSIPFYGII